MGVLTSLYYIWAVGALIYASLVAFGMWVDPDVPYKTVVLAMLFTPVWFIMLTMVAINMYKRRND